MTRADDIAKMRAAWTAGRYAEPGGVNAYYGQGIYARAWRLGYRAMQEEMLANSPARQAFLNAQKETPQP